MIGHHVRRVLAEAGRAPKPRAGDLSASNEPDLHDDAQPGALTFRRNGEDIIMIRKCGHELLLVVSDAEDCAIVALSEAQLRFVASELDKFLAARTHSITPSSATAA